MLLTSRIYLASKLCRIGYLATSDFIATPNVNLIARTYICRIPHFRGKFGYGRYFHSPSDNNEANDELDVDTSELRKLLQEDAAFVIDVRTDDEIKDGSIPAERWTNIPFDQIGAAFKLNKKEFESVYGLPMPGKEDRIIFHCKSGKRSTLALQTALQLGFKKAQHYPGGWLGWEEDTIDEEH